MALFCDDSVQTARLVGEPLQQNWREWELELVDGDFPLLDAAERLFAVNRVSRSDSPSNWRALGDSVPHPEPPVVQPGDRGCILVAALRSARTNSCCTIPWYVETNRVHSRHAHRDRQVRAAVGTFHRLLADDGASMLPRASWAGSTYPRLCAI
jgi:hypothetical protein